jgi:hypothetical protein
VRYHQSSYLQPPEDWGYPIAQAAESKVRAGPFDNHAEKGRDPAMAETANIAKIAELLASEVFSVFLWQQVGPWNVNFGCEKKDAHQVNTHPTDAVFSYSQPYANEKVYVCADLKSYAKSSISKAAVISALKSLASTISCAEVSHEWQSLYVSKDQTAEIWGMLFVYNHDGEYDKDFRKHLSDVHPGTLDIPKGARILVLGPEDIRWLDNVSHDIVFLRGKGDLPPQSKCKFVHPHLHRHANRNPSIARGASIEMLTGPWIMLEGETATGRRMVLVYYKRSGEEVEEFLYLIDYLKTYQVLGPDVDVVIRALEPHAAASAAFDIAVTRYIQELGEETEVAQCAKRMKFASITKVKTSFSPIEIGMDNGH